MFLGIGNDGLCGIGGMCCKKQPLIPEPQGDTDDYFEALGIAYGPRVQMGDIHIQALENAQEIIRRKMASVYRSVVKRYMAEYGLNKDADTEKKMERRGKQFINTIVNDTREVGLPKFQQQMSRGMLLAMWLHGCIKRGLSNK